MPDVELARREGIELVRTGSWNLLSGTWNPTREDILAAVEAAKCPAIRRPRLKLGHLDERFNGDGQPALGWFENLRAADDGHTLLGDQVALPWLSSVQAAAYPDRSVEGNYRHKCGLGHTHPFVITAVALLGVTEPGVKTLKSISDLPEMLGVAASSEVPEGAEHVEVTIRAAAEVHTGAMVALIPAAEDAERLAVEGGLPAGELHLTLAYLGEADELGARGKQDVIDHVSTVANGLPLLEAEIFSVNVYNPGGHNDRDTCLVWGVTGDMVDAVNDLVGETLHGIDAPIPSQHRPFAAHITAAYTGDLSRVGDLAAKVGPVKFDRLRIALAGEHIDIPLIEWPGDPEEADLDEVAAASGSADALHDYWTKDPRGLAKWKSKPHPWTALYRHLRKFLSNDRAKRTASQWYHDVFGRWPGAKKDIKASGEPTPILPAAEPEQVNPEPKEEDSVSTTDLSGYRSRLGLPDDADHDAVLEAFAAKLTEAEAKTPEPTPEMVAASAAAEKAKADAEAEVAASAAARTEMKAEIDRLSGELATIKASAATDAKNALFTGAIQAGKIKPADRESWEGRYDKAPDVITEILASIAPGTAVPVMASGTIGDPEPTGADADFEADYARHFGTDEKASV